MKKLNYLKTYESWKNITGEEANDFAKSEWIF